MAKKRSYKRAMTRVFVLFLVLLAGLIVTYLEEPAATPAATATPAPVHTAVSSGEVTTAGQGVSVWFTDPLAANPVGPEGNLIQSINGAQKTVDMAIYNLTLDDIGDALLQAKQRGVQVRLAMESEAMDKTLPQKLQDAGIPIVGDQREGLMHDKFTIIDGKEVWMGSMNYTSSSAVKDFNNLVRIRSTQAAQVYQAEFDQMFGAHKFGSDKESVAPFHQVTVDGVPINIYFSPSDGVSQYVLAELQKAQSSIDFLAYSFTSDDFGEAILERAKAGVKVRGVFDESQNKSNTGGEYTRMKRAGLDVRIDGISGLLHNKVMIIDHKVVITGSYNFSASAEKTNDENLVILHSEDLAGQYLQHFEKVYGSSQ